eukprot:9466209-Pyramimonas_sp.AAC.1
MQLARQRRNHERQANRMLGRAGQPATPITAGTPAFNLAARAAMQPPSVPPIQYEVGETILERQTRIRPSATPLGISDGDFNKCAICLDHSMHHDTVWRLQCGHTFHAQFWGRVARARVDRQGVGSNHLRHPVLEIRMQQNVMESTPRG